MISGFKSSSVAFAVTSSAVFLLSCCEDIAFMVPIYSFKYYVYTKNWICFDNFYCFGSVQALEMLPLVPTGIKIGKRTFPCGKNNVDARARLCTAWIFNAKAGERSVKFGGVSSLHKFNIAWNLARWDRVEEKTTSNEFKEWMGFDSPTSSNALLFDLIWMDFARFHQT